MSALDTYVATVHTEIDNTLSDLNQKALANAAQMIETAQKSGNRLHITGIGKPSHVAEYMASLFSSTGTPAYYLHGTEAVHGSCGQLVAGDVVICISNSGMTAGLKETAAAVRNNGCLIIAVTGNEESDLAKFADLHLKAHVHDEGGPLNRAPRASILSETVVLQALSVLLQEHRALTAQEYVQRHPGGTLGTLRENEK